PCPHERTPPLRCTPTHRPAPHIDTVEPTISTVSRRIDGVNRNDLRRFGGYQRFDYVSHAEPGSDRQGDQGDDVALIASGNLRLLIEGYEPSGVAAGVALAVGRSSPFQAAAMSTSSPSKPCSFIQAPKASHRPAVWVPNSTSPSEVQTGISSPSPSRSTASSRSGPAA